MQLYEASGLELVQHLCSGLSESALLVALLARELGEEPEPEPQALYRRLVGGDSL